ncbi:MAG: hypothetical protein ACXWDO_07145 [Bacteroidia bacterium]
MRYLLLVVFCFTLISCEKVEVKEIAGDYNIDKGEMRDTSINIENFAFLSLKPDMSFTLRRQVNPNSSDITGKWKILGVENNEVIIQFDYQNRQIEAPLRHYSRFDFEYPNEFHEGKFKHLLYFKLDDTIENIYYKRNKYRSNPNKSRLIDSVLISDDSPSVKND